ncbi:MAG: hypothetical protein LBI60_05775 [Bacteroidales bacterium]|jgi:hypothetical protein|nr:hypothetical protein [Bacteroidales bacterium]
MNPTYPVWVIVLIAITSLPLLIFVLSGIINEIRKENTDIMLRKKSFELAIRAYEKELEAGRTPTRSLESIAGEIFTNLKK